MVRRAASTESCLNRAIKGTIHPVSGPDGLAEKRIFEPPSRRICRTFTPGSQLLDGGRSRVHGANRLHELCFFALAPAAAPLP
ncbi:hypothetical protein BOSE62_150067 [Bosea sp. 62]|nr:hypothetical protein BOSE21B_11003 [Bosea sp. 21B]CAD5261751.1 hypothetical protein BOSE7B_150135 [Bosea sp. 7B]CAD5272928.1 hypothetical protein BOSE46_20231 [Bosea sp. 46]VVT43501.1 hypothetical protein BOS5A_10070 [Bosea sp. EC-HK365B]VXB25217.1 hypothetical protein BOSE29B_10767 [Bosea sp. 29B]VXB66694.1 hypothetical protein BOSE62_150067 [Bosea sp. 62]VXC32086.1 hypothetical protein BOSE127_180137 [Bosea sp. 127]VXC58514.1 hypothetical protein BOSE125_30230 [Bosea sp. 125]